MAVTYDGSGQDQDSDDKDNDHKDVVESPDGTIQISHRRFKTESLSVDTEDGRLDLVSSSIAVAVLVEYLERDLGSL